VLFGGYGLILACALGGLSVGTLALLTLAKIIATNFTISSGGSGGVFAPSLAIGAALGGAVGQCGNMLFPALELNPTAFALVGMGGFFAGVAKTPLAAVVMVSEMTAGYGLLAPLLLVSVLHMLLSGRWSLYSQQVPGLVDSPAHAGDFVIDVLARLRVHDLRQALQPPLLVDQDTTLHDVLWIVADAKTSYFPVVDDEKRLVGIFSLTDLRRIYHQDEVADVVIARDFMVENVVTARLDDSLDDVMRKMTEYHIHVIPVVDDEQGDHVIGLLDRTDLGRAYDRRLREMMRAD
jgi:CIC family chloride channel protein